MGKALKEYINFWESAYQGGDPWHAVKEIDGPWPDGLKEALGDYALLPPEPFYGFLDNLDEEARKRDILMLFINPGHVDHPRAVASKWTEFHTNRYLEWDREDYLLECGVHDLHGETNHQKPCTCPISKLYEEQGKGCQWRRGRYGEARNNMGWKQMRFLHTMEYSFYHSNKWSDLAPFQQWISSRPTTKLAWNALREIAEEGLVSRIVTIGINWRNVLLQHPESKLTYQMNFHTERGGYSHRFCQFSIGNKAIPIVSYISGAGTIRFPQETRATEMLDRLTEGFWDQGTSLDLDNEDSFDDPNSHVNPTPVQDVDPCENAGQYLERIWDHLDLSIDVYAKTGIKRASNGKFKYLHFAKEHDSVWHLDRCMMKLRAYCNREVMTTRVEFGFSQDMVNLSSIQKDYLRSVLHQYAKLHGLMEHRRFPEKHHYNVYAEFDGEPEAVIKQTVLFGRKLLKAASDFIDSIGEDRGPEESNGRE